MSNTNTFFTNQKKEKNGCVVSQILQTYFRFVVTLSCLNSQIREVDIMFSQNNSNQVLQCKVRGFQREIGCYFTKIGLLRLNLYNLNIHTTLFGFKQAQPKIWSWQTTVKTKVEKSWKSAFSFLEPYFLAIYFLKSLNFYISQAVRAFD